VKARPHQLEGANWAIATMRTHGCAYLSWKERTGKTLTALTTAEISIANKVLIVTKKKAIKGWNDTLAEWKHKTKFTIINYESLHKVVGEFDMIIVDEAHHAISSTGRPSKTWKMLHKFTHKKAILYLSATPYAEHLGLIYHQLKLSSWTPFKERNFYDWFKVYGKSNLTRTPYGLVEQYNKYDDEAILAKISHLFNFKTREEVGIEHEPTVNLIKVALDPYTIKLMKELVTHSVIEFGDEQIVCDSPMKQRSVHYQLEGSTIKGNVEILLPTREKVCYIIENYPSDVVVMAHFIAERALLRLMLPEATILSSDGDAEGVDLSNHEKLVIYSMSEKTSKFTQRLARQANHDRKTPIIVDVLVCDKPAIGLGIYESVALKKVNFDKNSYDKYTRSM